MLGGFGHKIAHLIILRIAVGQNGGAVWGGGGQGVQPHQRIIAIAALCSAWISYGSRAIPGVVGNFNVTDSRNLDGA